MNTPCCILARSMAAASLTLGVGLPAWAEDAGFFENAKTDLLLRNYYFNRDFRDPGAAKSQVEEWAQGFILKFNSGYTPGTVGFGLDGIAMFGVKLDSSRVASGSELLPVQDDGQAADNFGRVGMALKMRISATELKVGELLPDIPVLRYDDGRLLPQTFRGAMLDSREIEGLGLKAGQYRSVSLHNSSDMEDLSAWAAPGVTSDGFNYAGAEYRFNQQRTLVGAWHSQLEVATARGCPFTAAVAGPWATICSTVTSATPTSAPGRRAMTTTSSRWVFPGCWRWCVTAMVITPLPGLAVTARSGSVILR
ncbi:hypothetical protein PS833_00586 [Pseudomonas fluorescens]|uniref:Porin-like protein NicP n=1 Tax=Pseudomonas fluorescens TaxID=294 RepID=A0A5E7ABM1_PSEFL|nr:hypothetical protein PS833_00586 [Pseudomonas fluorescens]